MSLPRERAAPLEPPPVGSQHPPERPPPRARDAALAWTLVALITLGGAVLRLIYIGKVQTDPFYDAAVRSMGLSWHNFFFGAFDPSGATSIDKPPVDLWLQVAFVKVLGFDSTTLKLPEALAGILSIPLLFAAVRRMWPTVAHGGAGSASSLARAPDTPRSMRPGPACPAYPWGATVAGLVAALALAVLPVEVITSRSDTMDGLMMALIVLALYLTVRACESGRLAWLLGAAAVLGVAFDVKLLESLVALPGLALLAYLGMPGSRRRRLLQSLAAGAVYVAVALAWLTATLLFPAHERPYAIGSTNGSAWNAAFVFNGTDRLGPKEPEPGQTVYESSRHYPTATQADRDHIPIVPPSPTRLLATVGPLSGERLGLELLVGLLLGIPALIAGVLADRRVADDAGARGGGTDAFGGGSLPTAPHARARIHRAVAVGLVVWTLTGIVLFSHMIRLHPRYVEGLVPAVAALVGIGVAWACSIGGGTAENRVRLGALIVSLVVTVYYVERLEYGRTGVWWISLAGALGAIAFAGLLHLGPRGTSAAGGADRRRTSGAGAADRRGTSGAGAADRAGASGRGGALGAPSSRTTFLTAATIVMALVAVLVLPLSADVAAIRDYVSDAGYVGGIPREQLRDVSSYVRAHQDGARYELAAASATEIGALIVKDVRPVVILTTYNARVFTNVAQLRRLIARGEVRYAFLNTFCTTTDLYSTNAACSEPVRWIRAHGTDVSRQAGLRQGGVLYLLPGTRS